ncbi:MAG: hypothetical protein A2W25_15020 [candidate division Zixibacteria bacterium RBG_16_53_22]|nr:MAG: hypothetical protein A2W25_15020 [candidate division Zixibacteria bacterium RBG_16_53_22]
MNDKEQEILRQAIAAFEIATQTRIKFIFPKIDHHPSPEAPLKRADAVIKMKIAGEEKKYIVKVKTTITPAILGNLIIQRPANQLRANPRKWLLVARYIPRQYARILTEKGIPFIDTAGNAYINEPPIHIDIQGKRPEGMEWPKLAEKGILRQAGLRVVYALICKNELVNATFREIAEAAEAALGTVDRVFKDLKKRNFIVQIDDRGRRLIDKRELINWWVKEYADKLRPKLLLGRFETDDYERFQLTDVTRFNARWGGETAAGIMTNYLRSEVFTIYARRPINDLILKLRLRNRPAGKIEIRQRFWNFEDGRQSKGLVHPILVYADLLATADPRNIETAKIIYDAIIAMEN